MSESQQPPSGPALSAGQGADTASGQTAAGGYTCLDFRRAKLADPHRLTMAAEEHLMDCPACQRFARRVNEGERRMLQVLENNAPVPDGLAERVILMNTGRKGIGNPPWKLLALAATVVMSVGVGIKSLYAPATESPTNYAMEALEHTKRHDKALLASTTYPQRELHRVMATFGADLQDSIGEVRMLQVCPMQHGHGWHIVLDTNMGKITLMLFPNSANGAGDIPAIEARDQQFVALAERAGSGYFAVVGSSREQVEAFTALLRQHVKWSTPPAPPAPQTTQTNIPQAKRVSS